jgi:RHS repeat-associated protein
VLEVYFAQARLYDAGSKRFVSTDLIAGTLMDTQTLNPYSYCNNNPVNLIDPTGMWDDSKGDGQRNAADQAAIMAATDAYYAAQALGDTQGMANAHNAAEWIRENPSDSPKTTTPTPPGYGGFGGGAIYPQPPSAIEVLMTAIKRTQPALKLDQVKTTAESWWNNVNAKYMFGSGSSGDNVKSLQKKLNELGYTDANGQRLDEDKDFGPSTLAALNKFKDAMLPGGNTGANRGVVGLSTWIALGLKPIDMVSTAPKGNVSGNSQAGNASQLEIIKYTTNSEKFMYLFGSSQEKRYYVDQSEAASHMQTIEFPAWKYDNNGNKVKYTKKLTVNENISDMVSEIFTEIFNDPEQFVILDDSTGAYSWRYDRAGANQNAFSHHAHGIAIDINWNYNPQYRPAQPNGYVGGEYDEYTIKSTSSVVRIFKEYNWQWGGDWNSTKDYMHFQWTFS